MTSHLLDMYQYCLYRAPGYQQFNNSLGNNIQTFIMYLRIFTVLSSVS